MNGVSPREVDFMSLYKLFSTFAKMPKKNDRPMTDAEFDAVKDRIRAMGLKDVRI